MEKQVIFRDYQEQNAGDHNDLQGFVRQTFDDLGAAVVTKSVKFDGLLVSKTGQVEITITAGILINAGAIYKQATSFTQSMSTYTADAGQRLVAISARGFEDTTDNQSRDYVVDASVDPPRVEPRAVDMTSYRGIVVRYTSGGSGAAPSAPPIPAGDVLLATVLMDTTQIVSVTMASANMVASTDSLDGRTDALETFQAQINPRVSSLASDLASLQVQVGQQTSKASFARVFQDVARIKAKLLFPDDASDYGTNYFLAITKSDVNDTASLGYSAKVMEGIRFPDDNANQFEISIFSANDPNASLANGILLPKYTEEVKFQTGTYASDLGIAQYGFQTVSMQQGEMARSRIRYGGSLHVCTNGAQYDTPGEPAQPTANLFDYTEQALVTSTQEWVDPTNPAHYWERTDTYWLDTWEEPFMYAVTTDHTIVGAFVAQSFLVSNDLWATKVGFYLTAIGGNADVNAVLCQVTNGQPDLTRVIARTTVGFASLVVGWNDVPIPATFFQKGSRLALVLLSNANHRIGMADGNQYLNGTFFYSTDGIYYQGDLTKDMMLRVTGAKFTSAQVAIEFAPINLNGGFRTIDILANMWVPDSCELTFQIRPNGAGDWKPIADKVADVLTTAPPLAQFRAVFSGTSDVQPALTLTGSRVKVTRPKTAYKEISTVVTLADPSNQIHVTDILEGFDETPHDAALALRIGASTISASTTVTTLLDADAKRYQREYVFNLGAMTSSFRFIETGATTSVGNTYHVAERTFYSL